MTFLFLAFNNITGEKKFYERFYADAVKILNDTFSLVKLKENNKPFLWSERSDKKILLTQDYSDFKNIGERYIISTYYPVKILLPKTIVEKGKNKISLKKASIKFVVPVIEPASYEVNDYAVLANNDSLNILLSGKFTSCKPLYEFENDIITIKSMIINPELTGLLCSFKDKHFLYNSSLKLIKTFTQHVTKNDYPRDMFPSDDATVIALLDKCSKLLKINVTFEIPAKILMGDNMEARSAAPIQDHHEETIIKTPLKIEIPPQLEVTETPGGNLVSINNNGIQTKLFLTKFPVELTSNNSAISMNIAENDGRVFFFVDLLTHKLLLPNEYVLLLKLKLY